MAISYVSGSITSYASRTNTTITAPSSIADNDILLAFVMNGNGTGSVGAITPPAGFSEIGTQMSAVDGGYEVLSHAYIKVASGESGDYTFTHAATPGSQGLMVVFRGVDTTTPQDVTSTANVATGATTTWTGLTTATAAAYIVALSMDWGGGAADLSPPSGMTEALDTVISYAAYEQINAPGATGNRTHTNNTITPFTYPFAARLIALRPAAEPFKPLVTSDLRLRLNRDSRWDRGRRSIKLNYPILVQNTTVPIGLRAKPRPRPQRRLIPPQRMRRVGSLQNYALFNDAPTLLGTLASTLDDVTLSSLSALAIAGTLAVTLDDVSLASASKLAIAASLAATLDDVTLSSNGLFQLNGSLASTLADVTLASDADLQIKATLAGTLDDVTLASDSDLLIKATLASTLADVTLSSTGALQIKGTLASTLDDLTLSSTSRIAIAAALASTLDELALTSTGGLVAVASLAATLEDLTLASEADLAIKGTLSVTLGALSSDGLGDLGGLGDAAGTLAPLTLSSTGRLAIAGTLSGTLGTLTLASTAILPPPANSAALNITLDSINVYFTGVGPVIPLGSTRRGGVYPSNYRNHWWGPRNDHYVVVNDPICPTFLSFDDTHYTWDTTCQFFSFDDDDEWSFDSTHDLFNSNDQTFDDT